jgi:hypothetical protein
MNYVKIKKIEKIANEDVYNMEVKEHHNFAVNGGYIVHNCMDATRYAVSELKQPLQISANNLKILRYGRSHRF